MNDLRIDPTISELVDEVSDDVLLRLERMTARRADRIVRRVGEDDRSVWQRAEAEVLGINLTLDAAV